MSGYWNVNSNLISTSATLGSLSITNITVGNIFYTGSIIQNGTSANVLNSTQNFIATNLTSNSIIITGGGLISTFNTNTIGSLFTTGGNVGINNINPIFANDILGTMRVSNKIHLGTNNNTSIGSLINANNNTGQIFLYNSNTDIRPWQISSNSSGTLSFNRYGSNNTMIFDSDTNITASNLLATTSISTGILNATNTLSTNNTLTNLILTSGSFGSLSSANISVSGNITVGGNLLVNGSLISVNVTSVNVIDINITAGILNATNITSINLVSTTSTIPNIVNTNITTSSLLATTQVSSPNILATRITVTNLLIGTIGSTLGTTSIVNIVQPANVGGGINIGTPNDTFGSRLLTVNGHDSMSDYFDIWRSNGGSIQNCHTSVGFELNKSSSSLSWRYSTTSSAGATAVMTSALTIGSTGNVGIGTTAPTFNLDISGTTRITSSFTTGTHLISNGNLNIPNGHVYLTTGSLRSPSTSAGLFPLVANESSTFTTSTNGLNGIGSYNLSVVNPSGYQLLALSCPSYISGAGVSLGVVGTDAAFTPAVSVSRFGDTYFGGAGQSSSYYWDRFGNLFTPSIYSTFMTTGNLAVSNNITVSSLVVTTGTLLMNSNQNAPVSFNTSYSGAFTNLCYLFAPNQTNGNNNCSTRIFHGQGVGANYNSGQIGFNYISSNNVNNFASFSVYGVSPTINVNGSGFVGIGTTGPSVNLEVSSSSSTSQNLVSINQPSLSDNNSTTFLLGVSGTNFNMSTFKYQKVTSGSTTNYFGIGHWSQDYILNVNGSRNVGINTTAPSYTLDIAGTSKISTRLDIGGIQPTLNTNTIGQLFITGLSSSASGPHIMMNTTQDQFPTLYLHNWAHDINAICFDSYFDGNWRTSNANGGFALWKTTGQLQMRYTIGSAGSLIANGVHTVGLVMTTGGNVGISTTAPAFTLDITGTSRITTGLTIGGYVLTGTGSANGFRVGTATRVYDDGEMHLQTTSGVMHLDVGGLNDAMYLTNTNIGINVSQVTFSNGTRNTILFNNNGLSAPINAADLGSGCKLKLRDYYGIGIESSHMWFCTGNNGFKWYNGTTAVMQLTAANLVVTGDISGFGTISDQRLKTNINSISGITALDTIKSLRPVTFNWREDIFNKTRAGTSDSGFIAQEVEPIIPHAIGDYTDINSQTVYKNMRHERIIPYLTAAIQQLVEKQEEYKALFEKSEQKQKDLQTEIDLLKSKIN